MLISWELPFYRKEKFMLRFVSALGKSQHSHLLVSSKKVLSFFHFFSFFFSLSPSFFTFKNFSLVPFLFSFLFFSFLCFCFLFSFLYFFSSFSFPFQIKIPVFFWRIYRFTDIEITVPAKTQCWKRCIFRMIHFFFCGFYEITWGPLLL